MTIKLECSEQEAKVLMLLIDAAVKSRGIQGAGDAVFWVQKIETAVRAAQAHQAEKLPLSD